MSLRVNYQEPVYIKPLKEAQYVTEHLHALPEVARRSHRLKNSGTSIWGSDLKKKKKEKVNFSCVIAVVPLQIKCFHLESCVNSLCKWQQLFCMKCRSVLLFLKIYISFHVFKVNGLNPFLSVCTCKSVYG